MKGVDGRDYGIDEERVGIWVDDNNPFTID